MRPFERLLYATDAELARIFRHLQPPVPGQQERLLDEEARELGLERAQLICACGFNPNLLRVPALVRLLGYPNFDGLWKSRNQIFVADTYRSLSIDDILAIYTVLGRGDGDTAFSELIKERLTQLEENIEATINPITLGSYKLEVRSIYERNLVSRRFLDWRLGGSYAVLRRQTGEVAMMLGTGLISPAEILAEPGVTVEEKARLVQDGLVPVATAREHLAEPSLSEGERRAMQQAIARAAAG